MLKYEYKVVPAPTKGVKAKGVKGPDAMFALALAELMNEHGREGWEYQRAETLPSDERKGLTGRVTVTRHVLVFRREIMERPEYPAMPPLEMKTGVPARKDPPLSRGDGDLAAE